MTIAGNTMNPASHAKLSWLVERQLAAFPDHRSYLEKRFAVATAAEFAFAEEIAGNVIRIAGSDLDGICADYKWLSGIMLEEELHFRRTGRYRLSTFEVADREVYSDRDFMTRYMNGLLVSQLWWRNHTEMLRYFRDTFVAGNPAGFTHLEIGPGHGLFLALAAGASHCGHAEAWDISDASLDNTSAALKAMGLGEDIALKKVNLLDAPPVQFDSVCFSEVLEHLEKPAEALAILHRLLAKGGRLFVNAPVNSPAPDHLYLFSAPEEVAAIVEAAGFVIEDSLFAPCTGATLERARKLKLSISAGVIARKR